jgi:two-component system, chemotaxis family, sensor kinase Cph1
VFPSLEDFKNCTRERMLQLKEAAIEATSSGFVISDFTQKDNPLIYVNKAFCEMTGYSQEEVINKNCRFLQAQDKDQPEIDKLRIAIKEHRDEKVLLKNYKKDGTVFWNELIISPVKDEDENVTNYIGIQTDVTERVNARFALKKKTQELEQSNQDLEEFANAVSHDLKEPLRMISTFLEFLDKEYSSKLDKQAKEYIDYALKGSDRMKHLIEDLLDYSKVGAAHYTTTSVDLNKVIEEVLENLQLMISEKSANIIVDKLPSITGNEFQVITLFQNLISNAIKYCNQAPEVKIGFEDDGQYYIFYVADNGIGIDDHYQDYVFQIFNRLHSKKEFPGNGIGLAICKRIVNNLNGSIWLESKKGEGSKFYFRIPKETR